jgi:hypothetical protein
MNAWPSTEKIAEDCGWDERKVKRVRNGLVISGHLGVQFRSGKSNVYTFKCNIGLYYGMQDVQIEEIQAENAPSTKIEPPTKNVPPTPYQKCTPYPLPKMYPEDINQSKEINQDENINQINTLSIKNENQNQNFSPKSEDQKAPPAPAPPPVDPLINAIELSMRWAQENAATVKFWFDTYKIEDWTPEKLKQEIGVFFSHYQTEHQSDLHTCRKDPAKYFASGFLKWLSRYSKQDTAKTQQRPNFDKQQQKKSSFINDAPQVGVRKTF